LVCSLAPAWKLEEYAPEHRPIPPENSWEKRLMKPQTYVSLLTASWVVFWLKLWENDHPYWWAIPLLVGFFALYSTVALCAYTATGETPKNWLNPPPQSPSGPAWLNLVVVVCWTLLLLKIADTLPPYWSQLCPLIAVSALFVVSKLFPRAKPGTRPEDDCRREGANL
jgi:hypothetical protein